ncbi:MAG: Gfo/Idh/MocA family oxidoreductase [Steroidobacteraceae bacterium]
MTIAVGLVGFGLAGRVLHAPLIRASGMEIVGVVSSQRDAVNAMLPAAQVCSDLAALLPLPQLDLVVIATPNDLHEPQVLAALAAGKHVVVDKPMALDVAGSERMMRAAGDARRLLVPFHNRRWDSDFLTVQQLIASSQLGAVHTYEAYWDRFRPEVPDRWREYDAHGGGVLFDLGTHLIDQALTLLGMPDWLQADVYCQRAEARVDDAFEIRMGRGRMRFVLGASALAAQVRPRFRVSGERACYVKQGIDPQEDQLRAGMRPDSGGFGLEPASMHGQLTVGDSQAASSVASERGCWRTFYGAVRASIETGAAPPVTAMQARQVLALIEAARLSSRTGARVPLGTAPA